MRAHLIIVENDRTDLTAWTGDLDQLPVAGMFVAPPGTCQLYRVAEVDVFLGSDPFANIRAVPDDRVT